MSIVEYTGPSNPQEIRKYLMRRTKEEIVHEYLRQWRYSGDLEAERDAMEKRARAYEAGSKNLQAERDALAAENDSIWETLIRVADMLGIDPEKARKVPGKPSAVYADHLSRLKAEWQAEAIKSIRDDYCIKSQLGKNPSLYIVIDDHLEELRRQTEGDEP